MHAMDRAGGRDNKRKFAHSIKTKRTDGQQCIFFSLSTVLVLRLCVLKIPFKVTIVLEDGEEREG